MRKLGPDSTNTSSNAAFATLGKWISICEENHHLCQPPTRTSKVEAQGWLPSRLVQIDMSSPSPMSVRVITTTEHMLAPDSRYTTLSYCWGPPPITFKRLLRASIEDMNAGFDVTILPKTFQDAIAVTSLLGLKLIWIDALCIVHDSEEDWKVESVRMSQIYSRAYINLAAVASVDAYGGLFRERDPFSLNPFDLKIKWPGYLEGSFCCVPNDPWVAAIRESPWSGRAWTFQERLLSARTVYFAEDQLYWECGELCASEIYPLGGPFDPGLRMKSFRHPSTLPDGIQKSPSGRIKDQYALLKSMGGVSVSSPGFLQVWGTIVENYSKGRLTYPRDRLVAISGVAKQLSDHETEQDYFLGLWRQHLPLLLLWKDLKPKGSSWESPPLVPWLGPSWTWSSHLNPVKYDFLFKFVTEPEICAEVLDIDVTPGITTFIQDRIESGRLVIKAPMIQAKASTEIRRYATRPLLRSIYILSRGIFDKSRKLRAPFYLNFEQDILYFIGQGMRTTLADEVHLNRDHDFFSKHLDVFCVKIASADVRYSRGDFKTDFGLILSYTGQRGQYRRAGCFAVIPKRLVWSWRADRWFRWLRFRSSEHLEESLFQARDIESKFYQDFDGVGAYTIEII